MKYDDLVKEADRALLYTSGGEISDLPERLALAIRDLQQHLPPDGWRVTEYTREDGKRCVQHRHWAAPHAAWKPVLRNGLYFGNKRKFDAHSTATAAMAAIEETK